MRLLVHAFDAHDLQLSQWKGNSQDPCCCFFPDSVGKDPQSVTEYPELPKLQLKTATERMPTTQCMYTSILGITWLSSLHYKKASKEC